MYVQEVENYCFVIGVLNVNKAGYIFVPLKFEVYCINLQQQKKGHFGQAKTIVFWLVEIQWW